MIDTSKGHVSIAKVDLLIQLTFRAAAPWPWAKPVVQGEPLARTGVNGHAAVEVATLRLGVPAALGVRSAGTLLTHKAKKHVAPRALSPVVELEVSVFASGGLNWRLSCPCRSCSCSWSSCPCRLAKEVFAKSQIYMQKVFWDFGLFVAN